MSQATELRSPLAGDHSGASIQVFVLAASGLLIVLGSFARDLLPARFLLDDAHIQATMTSPTASTETLGYRNIAMVYRLIGLDQSPALAGVVAMVVLVASMFAAVHFSELRGLTASGLTVLIIGYGLGAVYLACYSKEFVGLAVVALVLVLPRAWASELIVMAAMVGYAATIRPYWAIVAVFYLAFRLTVLRVRRPGSIVVLIFLGYAVLQLVFTLVLNQDLSFARAEVNGTRNDASIDVSSLITDLLPAQGWLAPVNAMIMLASLIVPWPLVASSITHAVSAVLVIILWLVCFAAVGRLRHDHQATERRTPTRDPRTGRALALLLALVVVQAIFEPDYGSYLKHLAPMLPLFFALVPLRPRDPGTVITGAARPAPTILRVLHVTDASASGVLTAVSTLARTQQADPRFGRVVLGYVPRPESPSTAEIAALVGPHVTVQPWSRSTGTRRLLDLCRELSRALRRDEFDVVHLHSSRAGLLGRWVARCAGTPALVVYSPHAFAFAYARISPVKQHAWWLLELLGCLAGRHLVLVSDSEQDVARRRLRFARTAVLPNAVDAARLRTLAARGPRITRPIVAHIGRINPAKDPGLFVRTVRQMRQQRPEVEAVWLGDGDRRLLGEDSGVAVSGWLSRSELHDRLREVSVLLFTSNGEGMSIAMLEAQAMGIPLVASRVTGTTDVVVPGVTGYLGGSADELSAALLALLGDPELAASMTAAALRRAADFDVADLAERSWGVYRQLSPAAALGSDRR